MNPQWRLSGERQRPVRGPPVLEPARPLARARGSDFPVLAARIFPSVKVPSGEMPGELATHARTIR